MYVATSDSVWAFELGQRAAEIAAAAGVAAVRFAPGPVPETPAAEISGPAPQPTPEQARKAAEIAAGATDENLRESVQKAVSFALARNPENRPV